MTEKILYYDCFSGISGDMHLGAMADLGVPQDYLLDSLSKLGLAGWSLRFTKDSRKGIHGTRADVRLLMRPAAKSPGPLLRGKTAQHGHRSHDMIRQMILGSGLSASVKDLSLKIFLRLAEAEAKVHNQPVGEVHFHEVGAVDSIIDIVGAAVCIDYLKPDRVLASTVELGGGFVRCQHGLMPVPAPAVAELLAGAKVKSGAVPFETTTPTGAAILAATVGEYTDNKDFVLQKSAYGVGRRDTKIPNLLRVFWGTRSRTIPLGKAVLLECNIDDMSGEYHGYLFDTLFAAGAADVWFSPIVMKKSRSAVTLSVLASEASEAAVAEALMRETTTFGLRRSLLDKYVLDREIKTVKTSLGELSVKTAFLGGKAIKSKPEYEDVKRLARENSISLLAAYAILHRELE